MKAASTTLESEGHRGVHSFLLQNAAGLTVKLVDFPLFPGYVFCRFDYRARSRPADTGRGFGVGPSATNPPQWTR
jgi:hypothetical protein